MEQGTLFVKLESAREALPVVGQVVISRTENGRRTLEITLNTDADGLTEAVTLEAPPREISLTPGHTERAYAAYDVEATAAGYAPVRIEGVQVYAGVEAYLPLNMLPRFSTEEGNSDDPAIETRVVIPPPAIEGGSASGPAPLDDCPRMLRVLTSVFIPRYITVHLGRPQNSAANETVSFPYYIKNVCSSEIYPTWPENALRANIYAQISLALNRIYTEWYPSKGYNFNITNSTQYDQYYVSGRNIFTNISRIVDEIFNTYLRRVGDFAPYYAEYCNGTTVTCSGMSQWGTVTLANNGLSPIQILRRYYGSNFELVTTNDIQSIPSSYPGSPLRMGSTGEAVRTIQRQLNRIARNYPAIGQQTVDGVFGNTTAAAVRAFQKTFQLTQDGVVGKATWYKISYIYVAVKRLAELGSEKEPYPGGSGSAPGAGAGSSAGTLREGSSGAQVAAVQYYLSYLAQTFYANIPNPVPDGVFGAATRRAVAAFQTQFGLSADGVVGTQTWGELERRFEAAYDDNNPGSYFGAYPGIVLRQGSRGLRVQQVQYYLLYLHYSYSSIPRLRADGIFGADTAAAVRAFQRIAGLTQDGVVGVATWTQLYSHYSQKNALVLTNAQLPDYPGYVLSRGSSGAAVLMMQNYLRVISRKYNPIPPVTPTGDYDTQTVLSVHSYQEQFGLPPTGRINEATWDSISATYRSTLESEHLECRLMGVAYPGQPITLRQTNVFVRVALSYYSVIAAFDLLLAPIPVSDIYTEEAMLAIREFQRTRGLPVTGTIDAETWSLLYTQFVEAYRELYPECVDEGELPAPFGTLGVGSRGAYVEQLQVWINALASCYCELVPQEVNGLYDEVTESNVYILQEISDLPLTGRVDRRTWDTIRALYRSAGGCGESGEDGGSCTCRCGK